LPEILDAKLVMGTVALVETSVTSVTAIIFRVADPQIDRLHSLELLEITATVMGIRMVSSASSPWPNVLVFFREDLVTVN